MAGASEESVNCLLGGKEMAAVRKKQWCQHGGRAGGRKTVVTNTNTQDCAIACHRSQYSKHQSYLAWKSTRSSPPKLGGFLEALLFLLSGTCNLESKGIFVVAFVLLMLF